MGTLTNEQCDDVLIIDHDVNRWIEVLPDTPGNGPSSHLTSSTTFNYSRHILDVIRRRTRTQHLKRLRRLFILLKGEAACCINHNHKDSHSQTISAVLKHIRDAELRLTDETKALVPKPEIETRWVNYDDLVAGQGASLVDELIQFQDFVTLNGELCFVEHLVVNNRHNSFHTKSEIVLSRPQITKRIAFYDELWANYSRRLNCDECARRAQCTTSTGDANLQETLL